MRPDRIALQLLDGSTELVDEALIALNEGSRTERLAKLDEILSGPTPSEGQAELLTERIEKLHRDLERETVGGVLFLLFMRAANEADNRTDSNLYRANGFLSIPTVQEFLFEAYEIDPRFHYSDLELYRTGTTSYILRSVSHDRVIKILRWKSRHDPFVTRQTERYDKEHTSSDYAPAIYAASRYYIVMALESGPTLREFAFSRVTPDRRLQIFAGVSCALCDALEHYATPRGNVPGKAHLDLSPDNVIVQVDSTQALKVKLIDFGINYVLREGIASVRGVLRAKRYIDPCVLADPEATEQADIYSLGVILMDVLVPPEDGGDPQDEGYVLDQAWEYYPELASIIEQMIDKRPENRLLLFRHRSGPEKYAELRSRVAEETELRRALTPKNLSGYRRWIERAISVVQPDLFATKDLWLWAPEPARERTRLRYLAPFMTWTRTLHSVTFALFFILLYRDMGISGIPAHLLSFDAIGQVLREQSGVLLANLPGRAVALSFSYLGLAYYAGLFSRIVVTDLSRVTEWAIRSTGILLWLPILLALFVEPTWWAYCSGIGVQVVALANFLAFRLTKDHRAELRFDLPESRAVDGFDVDFGHWGSYMALYGLGLCLVGLLLTYGVAKDEAIYAFLTVAVNMNILSSNCGARARPMRAGIERMVSRLRRARRRDRGVPPPHSGIPTEQHGRGGRRFVVAGS